MSTHTPGPLTQERLREMRERALDMKHVLSGCVAGDGKPAFENSQSEHVLDLLAALASTTEALERVGCRTAKILAGGNTCAEVIALGEVWDRCFVCAAIAKARGTK